MLYEMLTGRQPFQGATAPDVLASVLVRDPDFGALPPNLNPRLPDLIRRCLEKQPKRRWQAVGDLRAELETIAVAPWTVPARSAITLAQLDAPMRGATWMPDDNAIIFATSLLRTGLQRVPAAGGTPTVLTWPDPDQGETDHVWPEMLPDGRTVMFTITAPPGRADEAQVAVRDLGTGVHKILVRGGSDARYVASGHLVFRAGGTLRAVAFDLSRLEVTGTPVPVVPRLATGTIAGSNTAADFALAADGTLVYVEPPAGASFNARTLVWVDRAGREQPIGAPARPYLYPRLSPDGTRIGVHSADQEGDIWIWDLGRATFNRLTLDPAADQVLVWTPDGGRIVFQSNRVSGQLNLWWKAADGSGMDERLTTSDNLQWPTSISADGTEIVFAEVTPTMGRDLMRLSLRGARSSARSGRGEPGEPPSVSPLLQTRFNELNGERSLDGRWLAYESDSSGSSEIYVRPYVDVAAGQSQVSAAGGIQPVWARNGKELFYLAPDGSVMSVAVTASNGRWRAGTPVKVFQARYYTRGASPTRMYDVSTDGQRFLMLKPVADADQVAAAPRLVIVQHFAEELKRRVPVN